MTTDEIYTAILSGQADDGLTRIVHAIGERRKTIAASTFHSLQVGDRVRVDATTLRPHYIEGATATVKAKRTTKITVEFDELPHDQDPYGKFSGNRIVVPASCLVKIG